MLKMYQIDLNRYCIPNTAAVQQALLGYIGNGDLGKYMGDLVTCWWIFLVMAGISAVLGFIYLFLLRWLAKPILYISFVVIVISLIGGGFYAFFSY